MDTVTKIATVDLFNLEPLVLSDFMDTIRWANNRYAMSINHIDWFRHAKHEPYFPLSSFTFRGICELESMLAEHYEEIKKQRKSVARLFGPKVASQAAGRFRNLAIRLRIEFFNKFKNVSWDVWGEIFDARRVEVAHLARMPRAIE